jgi:hypothetical protein
LLQHCFAVAAVTSVVVWYGGVSKLAIRLVYKTKGDKSNRKYFNRK